MEVKVATSGCQNPAEIHENQEKQISRETGNEKDKNNPGTHHVEQNHENEKVKQIEDYGTESETPRGVLEVPMSGSESDSSSGTFSDVRSPVDKMAAGEYSRSNLKWKKLLDQVKKTSSRRFSNIAILAGYGNHKKKGAKMFESNQSSEDPAEGGDFPVPKPSWRNFTYEELKRATDDFSPDKLIGKGGHAEVFKGCLIDGQVVAVKKIKNERKMDEDKVGDFLSELGIIAHIDHPNAAKLVGFSSDRGLHLVLQFSPHGSLATVLHGSDGTLEWKVRYKVAIGIAEGLEYLHYNCQRRIVHRDITASNILLSQDYEAQISDFGLAKWLPDKWGHLVVSPIEGTFGYLAPEYFMHGVVHEKTDVFAFGVLLLELITGRRAVDSGRQSLVIWAKPHLEKNNVKEIVDPRLGEDYDVIEMKQAMFTASTCIIHSPTTRPNMRKVVRLLKGENEGIDIKKKSTVDRPLLLDGCDLGDYTTTTYLKDLNRHIELVME